MSTVGHATCQLNLKHQALWALKRMNSKWHEETKLILSKVNEFEEFCLHAYESSAFYKEKMKSYHDTKIGKKIF